MEIRTRGARIHVKEQGNGELALVLLHYYGGSSRTWDGVAAELSGQYRIVATDHRGWGESDAPQDGYTIADLANDAQDVIESLGLQRYVLVGHSMGGKTAQLLASRRPRGLAGVVLVAPSPPSPMALPAEARNAMASVYDTRESVEYVLDHVLTAKRLPAAQREQVIADSLRGAQQAKIAWPLVAMLDDITRDVASIDVPVIVISGEQDQVDRAETLQRELLPRIAGAKLYVLPDVGHLSPLEAPSAVASLIRQFVSELDVRAVDATRVVHDAPRTPEQVPIAFDAAFNAGDLDRVLDLFAANATMRMEDGQTIASGADKLRAAFAPLLAAKPRIHNEVRLSLVSDDIALVLMDWTVDVTLPDGRAVRSEGTATQVMAREKDGAWKLRISNPPGVRFAEHENTA